MIDFKKNSKENARMLIQNYLKTGRQPDFIEYLPDRNFYIKAEVSCYSPEYALKNFCIYSGLTEYREIEIRETRMKVDIFNKVTQCEYPCEGVDLLGEINANNIKLIVKEGTIHLEK